jgi:hypothetical protein
MLVEAIDYIPIFGNVDLPIDMGIGCRINIQRKGLIFSSAKRNLWEGQHLLKIWPNGHLYKWYYN